MAFSAEGSGGDPGAESAEPISQGGDPGGSVVALERLRHGLRRGQRISNGFGSRALAAGG